MVESNLSKTYILLSTYELIDLRIRLNISYMTADHLFDLPEGFYEMFEKQLMIQTVFQDNIIRMTDCFDDNGRNILPVKMQIERNNYAY
jgi:hypothetical protein